MQSYYYLDIETHWKDSIAIPFAVSLTKGDKILFFQSNDASGNDVILFLLKNLDSRKTYYVHNLSFEAFCFMKNFKELGVHFNVMASLGVVYSLKIFYNKKTFRFRCSYRLSLLSLNELASLSNESKLEFPYSLLIFGQKRIVKVKENDFNSKNSFLKFIKKHGLIIDFYKVLREYCISDVALLKKGMEAYFAILNKIFKLPKKLPLTAASLSVFIFFKEPNLIKKKIPIKFDDLIRKAYYGGRCEVFGNLKGDEQALHFDFKGMYSQCMTQSIPAGEFIIHYKCSNFDSPGFYHICFEQHLHIPVLPVRLNNKLMFVNGTFEGWYWFEEIKLFESEGGKIKKVFASVNFSEYGPFMKTFVEKNIEIRDHSVFSNLIGKNNNNLLYGKLGVSPKATFDFISFDDNIDDQFKFYSEINSIKVLNKSSYKPYSNVSIAAAITSKARIKLYVAFKDVIKAGGRLLYTDTDSIVAAFKKTKLDGVLDKKIGEVIFDSFKKDTILTDAIFCLPKTYALILRDSTEVCKMKGFIEKIKFNKLKWAFKNEKKLTLSQTHFLKIDHSIKKIVQIKTIDLNNLEKRTWDFSKTETFPIVVKH